MHMSSLKLHSSRTLSSHQRGPVQGLVQDRKPILCTHKSPLVHSIVTPGRVAPGRSHHAGAIQDRKPIVMISWESSRSILCHTSWVTPSGSHQAGYTRRVTTSVSRQRVTPGMSHHPGHTRRGLSRTANPAATPPSLLFAFLVRTRWPACRLCNRQHTDNILYQVLMWDSLRLLEQAGRRQLRQIMITSNGRVMQQT
jgi:hypothetical protein